MKDNHSINLLRHRFVEDTGLPIQVLHNPYFMKRITLLNDEFGSVDSYDKYTDYVSTKYGSNINAFLEAYHSLRDRIIEATANSEAFKSFNTDDGITNQIKNFKPIQGEINLYTQEQAKEGDNFFCLLI